MPVNSDHLSAVRSARRRLAEVGPARARSEGDFERVALPHQDSDVLRDLLQPLRDAPAVHRLERNRLEDQEVERALEDVSLIAHAASLVDSHGEIRRADKESSGVAAKRACSGQSQAIDVTIAP